MKLTVNRAKGQCMIMYTTLGINDLAAARAFYDPTLATLGIALVYQGAEEWAYGPKDSDIVQLYVTKPFDQNPATIGNGSMLALTAETRAAVDAFYKTGLANGGTDEGAPGIRYSEHFYSCYLRDPDGNKLSAVCDKPI